MAVPAKLPMLVRDPQSMVHAGAVYHVAGRALHVSTAVGLIEVLVERQRTQAVGFRQGECVAPGQRILNPVRVMASSISVFGDGADDLRAREPGVVVGSGHCDNAIMAGKAQR